MILTIKLEEDLARQFQSNGVDNRWVGWVLSWANLLLTKIIWRFYVVDVFCYLEHLPLWSSGSCFLADCQLQIIG